MLQTGRLPCGVRNRIKRLPEPMGCAIAAFPLLAHLPRTASGAVQRRRGRLWRECLRSEFSHHLAAFGEHSASSTLGRWIQPRRCHRWCCRTTRRSSFLPSRSTVRPSVVRAELHVVCRRTIESSLDILRLQRWTHDEQLLGWPSDLQRVLEHWLRVCCGHCVIMRDMRGAALEWLFNHDASVAQQVS